MTKIGQSSLDGGKMSYTGTEEERKILQEAMQELHDKRGVTDGEVVAALGRWIESDPKSNWPQISVRTYNRYRREGVKYYSNGNLLYTFLSRGPDRFRMISSALSGRRAFTDDQKFIDTLLTRFMPSGGSYEYSDINSMSYTYELYRRSWRVEDGNHFVRSLLRIEREGGLYRITEVQKINARGYEFNETDEGWIIPYKSNFVAITNSKNCMKFFVFHQFFPLPAKDQAVMEMRGNLIAVSGDGPHPSFRILARRVTGSVDMGHYRVDKFYGDESMIDILNYIMEKN
ncbi:hypothetical protein [Salipiger aestuarii]|uniref:hypothetical protein n=1 Tax=Salipiger aestuarii TaxID=568098 RepID=UPI00168199F9|nr:hypothetical protein [Salipiger aestuarii]